MGVVVKIRYNIKKIHLVPAACFAVKLLKTALAVNHKSKPLGNCITLRERKICQDIFEICQVIFKKCLDLFIDNTSDFYTMFCKEVKQPKRINE